MLGHESADRPGTVFPGLTDGSACAADGRPTKYAPMSDAQVSTSGKISSTPPARSAVQRPRTRCFAPTSRSRERVVIADRVAEASIRRV
jgi:hypothetical protein